MTNRPRFGKAQFQGLTARTQQFFKKQFHSQENVELPGQAGCFQDEAEMFFHELQPAREVARESQELDVASDRRDEFRWVASDHPVTLQMI